MLNTNLLSFSCLNTWGYVNEILHKLSFFVHFFNTWISFCWNCQLVSFLDFCNHENRIWVIVSELFIDFNISLSNRRSGWIPSNNLFFRIDLSEHQVHFFMINMIQEPNLIVFLKRHSITICNIENSLLIFAKKSTHYSFPFLWLFCHSVVMVNNTQ